MIDRSYDLKQEISSSERSRDEAPPERSQGGSVMVEMNSISARPEDYIRDESDASLIAKYQ